MSLLVEYARQFGRFQRNARLYLISNALGGVTTGILLVLYNLYLISLGYAADFVGLLLFVGTLGAGLAIFPAGWCVDRFSGKAILIWSSLLIGVAGVGLFLFRQPFPLLVSSFIAGIGGAFLLVVNAPFLTANSTPDERSHLFSLNIVLTLVTTVLGKVVGGALPGWFRASTWLMAPLSPWLASLLVGSPVARSYQLALLFAGMIAGPSLIPLFLLSKTGEHKAWQGQALRAYLSPRQDTCPPGRDQSLGATAPVPGGDSTTSVPSQHHTAPAPMERPPSNNGGLPSVVAPLAGARGAPSSPLGDIWLRFWKSFQVRAVVRSPIFLLSLTQVLIGFGAGLFIPYFNIYFVQYLRASPALFGLIDGGATAITALLTLAAPLLAARLGKVATIALTELASIPLLLTIGLLGLLPLVTILYLFRQGLMDMSVGIFQVFSMEAAPPEHRGLANSSYQASYQVAWALSAPLGGLTIVHLGYPPIFVTAAVCYLLSIVVLWGNFGPTSSSNG